MSFSVNPLHLPKYCRTFISTQFFLCVIKSWIFYFLQLPQREQFLSTAFILNVWVCSCIWGCWWDSRFKMHFMKCQKLCASNLISYCAFAAEHNKQKEESIVAFIWRMLPLSKHKSYFVVFLLLFSYLKWVFLFLSFSHFFCLVWLGKSKKPTK